MTFGLLIVAMLSATDPDGVIATAPQGRQAIVAGAEAPVALASPSVTTSAAVQGLVPVDAPAHGLSSAQQIDRWIAQGAPASDDARSDPWAMPDDRKIHGQVSAAIGTSDYSAWSAAVSIPVGENGRVDLSYSESRNDPYAYGAYGYGYGDYGYGAPFGQRGYGQDYRSRRSQSVTAGASWGRDRPFSTMAED